MRLFIIISLSFFAQFFYAQEGIGFTNLRTKKIAVTDGIIKIDTLSIIEKSFSLKGIEPFKYKINHFAAELFFIQKPEVDSVVATYRVYPFLLAGEKYKFDYNKVKDKYIIDEAFVFNVNTGKSIFGNDAYARQSNMSYNGVIGRGLAFGNSQDASFNSNMNLQINGYIGDSIEFAAAITDNNIPIQPDGNTQNLNEIDRVWMQIHKNNWTAQLGDIDIRQSESKLLKFYKRLQGAAYDFTSNINNNITQKTMVSGAVAKGKFTRNVLQPIEGNQGPYRLQGPNNELFFVVLAGTERVYIDGQMLQRGEDQDYIINYNTAEITFTPKRIINKDLRIQIEFEFVDRNYLNSQFYGHTEWNYKQKAKWGLGFFSNSDAKNSPINQELKNEQKQFLKNVGNGIDTAFYNTAQRDTFGAGRILYIEFDTVQNGTTYRIYKLATNALQNTYKLDFSYVGPGKGTYTQAYEAANGRAYQWVGYDALGNKKGDYEAFSLLITPKKQQLINLYGQYNISEKQTLNIELAQSHYDPNLFSKLNQSQNIGLGYIVNWELNDQIIDKKNKNQLFAKAHIDNFNKNFRALERYRDIEFLRDWTLPLNQKYLGEKYLSCLVGLKDSLGLNNFSVGADNYDNNLIKANKFQTQSNVLKKGYRIKTNVSLTNINATNFSGKFFKPSFDITKSLGKKKWADVGLNYVLEYNKQPLKNFTDSLNPLSYGFSVWNFSIKSPIKDTNKLGLSFFTRQDWRTKKANLLLSDRSYNIQLNGELMKNENNILKWQTNYRQLVVLNKDITNIVDDKSLLGRVEYGFRWWKDMATGTLLYESGSGQEPRREFLYVEVPTGQGEFYWIDYNNNNIQELNEFEIAVFPDQRRFLRIFTPTNNYVKANYNQFNYEITIEPANYLQDKENRQRSFLNKLQYISSFQLAQKQMANNALLLNPFQTNILNQNLISENLLYSNALFINRNNTKGFGIDITQNNNRNKFILSYGLETRILNQTQFKIRYIHSNKLSGNLNYRLGDNNLITENPKFGNRNYKINFSEIEPSVQYQNNQKWRCTVSAKYQFKKNRIDSLEKLNAFTLTTDFKYQAFKNTIIQSKISYTNNNFRAYNGATNTTVGFVILDGLLPNKNYLWNLDFIRRLPGNLELTIRYEGRKTEIRRAIHTGQAGVRLILQ